MWLVQSVGARALPFSASSPLQSLLSPLSQNPKLQSLSFRSSAPSRGRLVITIMLRSALHRALPTFRRCSPQPRQLATCATDLSNAAALPLRDSLHPRSLTTSAGGLTWTSSSPVPATSVDGHSHGGQPCDGHSHGNDPHGRNDKKLTRKPSRLDDLRDRLRAEDAEDAADAEAAAATGATRAPSAGAMRMNKIVASFNGGGEEGQANASVVHMSLEEVRELCVTALTMAGLNLSSASVVASVMVAAEQDGCGAHGLARIPMYCEALRKGEVDGNARPEHELIFMESMEQDVDGSEEGWRNGGGKGGGGNDGSDERWRPLQREMNREGVFIDDGLLARVNLLCGLKPPPAPDEHGNYDWL